MKQNLIQGIPLLADKPGFWIACDSCGEYADPRFAEMPGSDLKGVATLEMVWRACRLRGWTGTPEEAFCPYCGVKEGAKPDTEIQRFATRVIPVTWQRVMEAVEEHAAKPSYEAAEEIKRAIVAHYQSGEMMDSNLCVLLGIGYALVRLYPQMRWRGRWTLYATIFIARHTIKRGSAGWNDFEMAAWMTTRDPVYVCRILKRLRTTRGMVQETCEWMVASTCQQNQEFAAQWKAALEGEAAAGQSEMY